MGAVHTLLDRHERRRRARTPTVSLLAGPATLGARAFAAWAAAQGRPVVIATNATEAATVLLGALDVTSHAAELLEPGLAARLARKTPLERALRADAEPSLADVRGLAAAAEVPPEERPCLLICRAHPDLPADWLRGAAPVAETLLGELPDQTVALACEIDRADLDRWPESRARALLREGLIPLDPVPPEGIAAALAESGATAPFAAVARLARDGADDELVELFARAALAVSERVTVRMLAPLERGAAERPGAPSRRERAVQPNDARSAAEAFLRARLDSLEETAGQFRANGRAGFRFGPGEAEVDLLAERLAIAIEIDGYHHFKDADAYRRDRRKDAELQLHGYVVLRFLADDVVSRLEDILETILAVVRSRTR